MITLKLIISQSSNTDSIVLDCFAGGGTTLEAAEQLNRKWIGIDQSDIAIETIKLRMKNVNYLFIETDKSGNNLYKSDEKAYGQLKIKI